MTAVKYQLEGEVAVLTVDNPPVNALSHAVRIGLMDGLQRAETEPAVKAIVLIGGGRTYMAGADLKEFGRPKDPPELHHIQAAMEASSKPIVSAIHGTALGGGLELALTGHWRVAVADAKLGLPEINLGLMPGAGGNQRMTHLVGPAVTLDMILGGEPISAREACSMGIIDEVVEGELLAGAITFARRIVVEQRPLRIVKLLQDKIADIDRQLFADYRKRIAQTMPGLLAPRKIIDCVEAACVRPVDAAFAFDAQCYKECLDSPQRQGMIHLFFGERATRKIPDLPEDVKPLPIRKVAAIGAGEKGCRIAMCFADAGVAVRLIDVSSAAVAAGLKSIQARYAALVADGSMRRDVADAALARIEGFSSYQAVDVADLVVEAVSDDVELKRELIARLSGLAQPECIFACSGAPDLGSIANVLPRPDKLIGLNFLARGKAVTLLEVVRGAASSAQTIVSAMELGRLLKKPVVFAGAGGMALRMLQRHLEAADRLLRQGCTPTQVESAAQNFGMAMGPFALRDAFGLHVATSGPAERREWTEAVIATRLIQPLFEEGNKLLAEGVALRASDIDVLWVHGFGFPPYHGGPMFWGEQRAKTPG